MSAASIEAKARLRAIRKLSSPIPDRTAEDRLKRIEGIASGKITPELGRNSTSVDLMQRLKAGQASRSPRIGQPVPVARKKAAEEEPKPEGRGRRGGKDRQERSGLDRDE